jgi:hypothetical protein
MRAVLLILALLIASGLNGCHPIHPRAAAAASLSVNPQMSAALVFSSTTPARVDFATQIRPILEARCQPCHFNGGKQYARMPFDRAETIKSLGTKMFTRIKDEREQQLLRDFLAQ